MPMTRAMQPQGRKSSTIFSFDRKPFELSKSRHLRSPVVPMFVACCRDAGGDRPAAARYTTCRAYGRGRGGVRAGSQTTCLTRNRAEAPKTAAVACGLVNGRTLDERFSAGPLMQVM